MTGMKCMKCGSEKLFRVNGDASVWVSGDGKVTEVSGSDQFDDDYTALCSECGHDDLVGEFRKYWQDRNEQESPTFAKYWDPAKTKKPTTPVREGEPLIARSQHRPYLRCTVDDPNVQRECAGYQDRPVSTPNNQDHAYCWFNYDANDNVTDECRRPGILRVGR